MAPPRKFPRLEIAKRVQSGMSHLKQWSDGVTDHLTGPALALLAVFLIQHFLMSSLRPFTPYPVPILVVIAIYSVFRGGTGSGFITTAITILYLTLFLHTTEGFSFQWNDAWNRLIGWTFALPIIVWIAGILKQKSLRAATLEERERSLIEITQVMPQMVWTAKPDGTLIFFNQNCYDYTGLTPENTFGASWETIVHPDDLSNCLQKWSESVEKEKPYEVEYRLRRGIDGAYRWHLGRALPLKDKDQKMIRWVGTCTDIQDQKEAQSSIQNQKQKMEMIFESMSAVIWAVDLNGYYIVSEGHGLKAVGLKPGEQIGKNIFEFYPEDHEVSKCTRNALRGEISKATFFSRGVWFEGRFSPTLDSNGAITGVVAIAMDVSARLESENAKAQLVAAQRSANLIKESEAKFKGAFDHSPIGLGLAHPTTRNWFDVNPALCKILGYTREELIKPFRGSADFSHPGNLVHHVLERMHHGNSETTSFEEKYRHKNGQTISLWINASFIRDSDEQKQYVLGQIVDFTEQRRAERILRETSQKLQSLLNSCPVGILALDIHKNITVWNPSCEQMFGWRAEEVIGQPLPFVPESKREESNNLIQKIFLNRAPVHFEASRVRRNGKDIKTATSAIPLFDEQGETIGLMAVITDDTEKANARENIIAANTALRAATAAKSEFLANMSHEIRTPINGVMGMTDLLLGMDLGSEQRAYAETIRSSAEMLLTLVNDILDFSKIEANKLDLECIDFDLDQITQNIERMLETSARKKGLRIIRSVAPEISQLRFKGDPTRIGQVLLNLLSNAIKFTERGQIMISLQPSDQKNFRSPEPNQTGIRVEVTDSGIGLSPEEESRMFQPFTQADASTTRRYGGTGLGLSICKRLVELMGGQIGVRSKVGLGSTFWFTLLLNVSEKKSSKEENEDCISERKKLNLSSTQPIRVLLAEDNPVNQLIAIKLLEKNGFVTDAVSNGKEVLLALNKMSYDVILMDCQMPEMDGYETSRRIRELTGQPELSQIPIIAMTAYALSGDREKCLEAGMNDYVSKPIRAQELIKMIYSTLNRVATLKSA